MATEVELLEELLHATNENTKVQRSVADDVRWLRNRIERVDDMHRSMLDNARSALRFGR